MVNKFTNQPTVKDVVNKINELADAVNQGGGTATDVQINGTSITSNNVANILTNTAYNSSSNKIATMSDLPTVPTTLSSFTDDLGSSPTHTHSQYLSSHQTIEQDGLTGATINRYCTCSTAASTAEKVVSSVTSGSFSTSLGNGFSIRVKFTYANTANSPTLKVGKAQAKNIFHNGSQITTGSNKSLLAGVCEFVYDGTQFHLIGNYIDTDTTYSSGTGITIGTGNAINHSNSVTAGTAGTSSATSGSTLAVPYVTFDAQGHITAKGTHTHTVTGFATSDTKNTAGSTDTSSKIFLVGATSQAANPQTYSHDTAFVDTNGRLNSAAPATSANDTTVATTKWVKDQGYKTSITSSDVTTALGYTPYNSTNPNGYTSNIGTVTSVNNTQPDANGNVTISVTGGANTDLSNLSETGEAHFLKNTATGTNALTIGGTASTATSALNIGATSTSGGGYSVAVGYYAASNGARTTSIGYGARIGGSTADAIQIGNGTNSTAKTLSVGFYNTGNYQLLDGATGLIPLDRISVMSGAGASAAGTKGLVPAPASGDNTKFLRGDGTWQTVSGGGGTTHGEWTISTIDLTTTGTGTYSINNYLPSGRTEIYEIFVTVHLYDNPSATSNTLGFKTNSTYTTEMILGQVSSNGRFADNWFTIPIFPSDITITFTRTEAFGALDVKARAYRKMG